MEQTSIRDELDNASDEIHDVIASIDLCANALFELAAKPNLAAENTRVLSQIARTLSMTSRSAYFVTDGIQLAMKKLA